MFDLMELDMEKLIVQYDQDAISVISCFQWLEDFGWEVMVPDAMANKIVEINEDIDIDMALEYYVPICTKMLALGRNRVIEILKTLMDESDFEELVDNNQ